MGLLRIEVLNRVIILFKIMKSKFFLEILTIESTLKVKSAEN